MYESLKIDVKTMIVFIVTLGYLLNLNRLPYVDKGPSRMVLLVTQQAMRSPSRQPLIDVIRVVNAYAAP